MIEFVTRIKSWVGAVVKHSAVQFRFMLDTCRLRELRRTAYATRQFDEYVEFAKRYYFRWERQR